CPLLDPVPFRLRRTPEAVVAAKRDPAFAAGTRYSRQIGRQPIATTATVGLPRRFRRPWASSERRTGRIEEAFPGTAAGSKRLTSHVLRPRLLLRRALVSHPNLANAGDRGRGGLPFPRRGRSSRRRRTTNAPAPTHEQGAGTGGCRRSEAGACPATPTSLAGEQTGKA
ncbi:unnamed protein product, partial [Musa textilis]